MAKKSRKYSMKPVNDNGGCMWGLVSLLDFRHPRRSPRFLLDGKRGSSRYSSTQKHLNDEGRSHLNHAENQKLLNYAGNYRSENGDPGRSIRLFLEEEISKLQRGNEEIVSFSGEGVSSRENNMQAVLTSNITCRPGNDDFRITTYSQPSVPSFQDVLERFSINLNLVALLQEFYSDRIGGLHVNSTNGSFEQFMRIDCSKLDGGHSEPNRLTVQNQYILRKTLNEILEVFLCDKINDLKRSGATGLLGQSEQSTNDALDVISLNKELFLKFLQDHNSCLARYIRALQISHSKNLLSSDSYQVLEDIKLLGNYCGNQHASSSRSKLFQMQNIKKLFRKKDKNVKSSTESDSSQSRSRIVVLKPIPLRSASLPDLGGISTSPHSPQNLRASGRSEAAAFHFSFHQIKRKMKQALERNKEQTLSSRTDEPHLSSMHKVQQTKLHTSYSFDSIKRISTNDMNTNSKSGSPNNSALTQQFYAAKISEKKPCLEDTLLPNTKGVNSMAREAYFQREARKHIIEMMDFGYGGFHLPTKKVSRTLEKMLSSRERNLPPKSGSARNGNSGLSPTELYTTPLRALTSGNGTEQVPTRKYNLDGAPEIDENSVAKSRLHDLNSDTPSAEKQFLSCPEESIPEGFKDGPNSSDVKILNDIIFDVTSGATASGTASMDLRIDGVPSHPHLRLGVIEVDQPILTPSAPPGVLFVKLMEAPDCFTEKSKQPSQVSILDTSSLDDCDSSRSTGTMKIKPAELPVSPRNLQFEEEGDEVILTTNETCMRSCTDDEDLRFQYVISLLEASGLASQESWWRWHSSRHLLHPSVYHQIEIASGDFLDDLKLLFDCVNEVLEEMRSRYCTRLPWVSFAQPVIRPFPLGKDLVEEVWQGMKKVNSLLLVDGTLDQIVRRDLDTGTWMGIRPQVNEIGVALEDEIWEELLEEYMLALWD